MTQNELTDYVLELELERELERHRLETNLLKLQSSESLGLLIEFYNKHGIKYTMVETIISKN